MTDGPHGNGGPRPRAARCDDRKPEADAADADELGFTPKAPACHEIGFRVERVVRVSLGNIALDWAGQYQLPLECSDPLADLVDSDRRAEAALPRTLDLACKEIKQVHCKLFGRR